jgi:hypothetical protein
MEILNTSTARAPAATKPPKLTKPPKHTNQVVLSTVSLPPALIEAAKNAVDALSGPPLRLTYSALVRDAVERELTRLQKAHHGGKPFPPRTGPLRQGRPLKR